MTNPNYTPMMTDAQGRLVPMNLVKPIDLARDQVVRDLFSAAREVEKVLADFKRLALGEVEAFLALSLEQYGVKARGVKGNVTLTSFDGRLRVTRQRSERITFDERLQAAKALIDGCIDRWAVGASGEIRALVTHAFQTDREGKVSTERILSLRRLDIKDPEWLDAMAAIGDSMQVASTATYLRFYERDGETENWKPLALNFSDAGGAQ